MGMGVTGTKPGKTSFVHEHHHVDFNKKLMEPDRKFKDERKVEKKPKPKKGWFSSLFDFFDFD